MKKHVFLLLSILMGLWGIVFAYEPSSWEHEELTQLKLQLNTLIEKDNISLWSLYQQARDLYPYFSDEKTAYYLEHLRDFLLTKLQSRKATAKFESEQVKKNFLSTYQGSWLSNAEALSENCYGRYQTLDNLSFSYDFPTALTIAVWYRESNCGYYLPKNGDGPFQIVSKDYGNGPITKTIFETTIKDFLAFSKKKIERYNGKNPSTPINLSYQNLNYQDLYKFAGLYNGLSGGTIYGEIWPAAPKYFFEKMPGEFENGKRNGLFLQTLRALERELKQNL